MQQGVGGFVGEHRHGAQDGEGRAVAEQAYAEPGLLQQGHAVFERVRVNAGCATDGESVCGAVVERQVQQDQVAQAVFLCALARHTPVAQGQHGIADPQQALAVAADDFDGMLAQARDQSVGDAQITLDHAGSDGAFAACRPGLSPLGTVGIAIKAVTALASQTPGIHQVFLDQRGLEAVVAVVGVEH